MSVEMFDYMDEILALQSAIFGSLDMSRSNSMTSSGQCRLAPLIPVIQDSSQLYDFGVKILFRLHASLPPDVLTGHRQRFLNQFRELRKFYIAASTLQYFRNLIQIPTLPENPPNFLVQAELRSYVTPVVILPEEPPDSEPILTPDSGATADLVDIGSTHTNGSVSPDVLAERQNALSPLVDFVTVSTRVESNRRHFLYGLRIKQRRVWLLLVCVTAKRSCPWKQPPCPAICDGGSEVAFKSSVLSLWGCDHWERVLEKSLKMDCADSQNFNMSTSQMSLLPYSFPLAKSDPWHDRREHLQSELSRLRNETQRLIMQHQQTVLQLRERVAALETDLATKDSELEQERIQKEELLQLTDVAAKFHEADKKAKTVEEKFQKLKEVYSKLRDEHIQLIRQKAGVDKALRGSDKMTKFARAANTLIMSIKADVDKQLANVRNVELESEEREKSRLEQVLEQLATLQATADTAAEHNQVITVVSAK
ncbi:histidine permease [Homalodisca vitripennis]|nr:histidine permease [Homalodisca vitripennis]